MNDYWSLVGFRENPYDVRPLRANQDDCRLHVGREQEFDYFVSRLLAPDGRPIIISGDGGIGKTSFVNHAQFMIASGRTPVHARHVIAHEMTSLDGDSTPEHLAMRITANTVRNLLHEANARPTDLKKARDADQWLSHEGRTSGLAGGAQIAGFGITAEINKSVTFASELQLEGWTRLLSEVVDDSCRLLGKDNVFVCIDNAEAMNIDRLSTLLMLFRDNLFQVPRTTWIVIGQQSLYFEIELANNRVAERLAEGIDLAPLNAVELHELIERRMNLLRSDKQPGRSPISQKIYTVLVKASCGEPRYVLEAANGLLEDLVADVMRREREALSRESAGLLPDDRVRAKVGQALGDVLMAGAIPRDRAVDFLKRGVVRRMKKRALGGAPLAVLQSIAANECEEVPLPEINVSEIEAVPAIERLLKFGLLAVVATNAGTCYKLKGDAAISEEYSLWEQIQPAPRTRKPLRKRARRGSRAAALSD